MGSKHRLAPRLAELFATLPPGPAIDAFSGSGVVAYTLKASGREVVANDHLRFTATLAEALVANGDQTLDAGDVERLCSPNRDGRDFIQSTFDGLYFPRADHAFLDAAWSHVDEFDGAKRALALSALCLAAAWKQPRGVFTVTTPRYDDGRRQLHTPLEALFREAVTRCNEAVIPGAATAVCGDVFALDPADAAIAYLDPPYAPPRDDTCYVKRYHFLEGLATYWRGQEIMWETRTRKLRKRHTPFGSKRTVTVRIGPGVRALQGAAGAGDLLRLQRRSRRERARDAAHAPSPQRPPDRDSPPLRVRHAPGRGAAARDGIPVRSEVTPRLYSGRCRRW